jgi:hypothetical protein
MKPFKITQPGEAGIGRAADGKFTRIVPPGPQRIMKEATEQGLDVDRVISERRAPDHAVPKGNPLSTGPEGGPVNDANKKPFRI